MGLGVWVIVVGGGSGARFGAEKQYALLGDHPVLAWSVAGARHAVSTIGQIRGPGAQGGAALEGGAVLDGAHGGADVLGGAVQQGGTGGVVLVVPGHRLGEDSYGADAVVVGGSTRSASVRAGLAAVPPTAEVIVVHDAARPLATAALFAAVVGAVLGGADAAVPGLAVTDTIRRSGGGTLDRSELVRVQTPQAFRAEALRAAHHGQAEATDDATMVEQTGGTVRVVAGEGTNIKLTDPIDLAVAELLLATMEQDRRPAAEALAGWPSSPARVTVPGAPSLRGRH